MLSIGIDVGSTNVKVALVADDGDLRGSASRALDTQIRGDTAVQDPDALWSAVVDAITSVVAAEPTAGAEVAAVGVCSQYSSIVGVDGEGRATSPVIMYLDRRGTDHCWGILERFPEAFDTWCTRHGIPPVGAGLSLAHLLHLQLDRPDTHRVTADYLEVMDFVNLRLTGRSVATQATMFASQLCDNRTVGATGYDADLLAMSGLDADPLPELLGLDAPVGPLAPEVAVELGLSPEVMVPAGMNDSHAAAFATGAFAQGRTGLMLGTTAVLLDTVEELRVDLDREVVSMPTPVPDCYLVMAENGLAGRSVEHVLRDLLAPPAARDLDPFEEIAAAMAGSQPGAGGVLFLPWLAGSLSPSSDAAMRGGFLGLTLETGRSDMVRAALEGTARNLRWLLPPVEDLSGHPTTEIVFGGGAACSPDWAQCIADVLDRPVSVLERPDVAVARAVGLVALHRHAGSDPRATVVPLAARHEPDGAATAVNDRLQAPFEATFAAVQQICHSLAHEHVSVHRPVRGEPDPARGRPRP